MMGQQSTSWIKQLDGILRGRATQLPALREGVIDISARGVSVVLLVLGMIYGVCMGLFSVIESGGAYWHQVLATTIKVPLLFFLTLLVTLPSLYVFNALVGSRLTLHSVLRLLVAAKGVMLAVLASFGTIVAFFSVSTKSYEFMIILNVVIFSISGILGLRFLLQTLHRLALSQEPPPVPTTVNQPPPQDQPTDAAAPPLSAPPVPGALDHFTPQRLGRNVKTVFEIWILVFALVGAQMAWILRPFIGNPNLPFSWFRPRSGNFFEAVWRTLTHLIGG